MGQGLWARPWVRHIAVAVSYGLAVVLFQYLSASDWNILTGLRLIALLLVPYRYWPALIVGESCYYVDQAIECAGKWGTIWSLCSAPPPIIYAIPIMYWVRERWNPIEKHVINMGRLLGCAVLVSAILMLRSMSLFLVMRHLPAGYVVDYSVLSPRYFVGNYLGILTVAPLVLLVHQMVSGVSWSQLSRRIANNRLVFESICLVAPLMVFLFWIAVTASSQTQVRQIVQIAMFLPVLWLALRHGWQGAAIGGTVASCMVVILTPAHHDDDTLRAEAIVAFAISTMLLMGARIAALDRSASQERTEFQLALALAQRNVYVGEMQLRMTSQALDQIRETVQSGFTLLMGRLRHLQPAVDDRGYQRQALVAQDQLFRLADGLYPVALRERGLPNALRDGSLARMLGESGLTYSCDLRGPVSKLSHTLRMTIYRVIWEAVTDGCLKKDVSHVRVRVRGVEKHSRYGVVVAIYFQVNQAGAELVRWDDMLPGLIRASTGLGLQAIQDRAAVFEGYAKTRTFSAGRFIGIYMLDLMEAGGGEDRR
jgi:two-component system, NarL family, sensor histidine kinase FusK